MVVHYEIYDGIPLISKWVSIEATPEVVDKVRVFVVSVESMAVNWQWANNGYGTYHSVTEIILLHIFNLLLHNYCSLS